MKEEPKHHGENLKRFLGKKPGEAMDDFEREALEGFAMLGNEDEIQALKSQTDERVNAALYPKKDRKNMYWFAAAGLFLCIGFAVYLLNENGPLEKKDLALEQTRPSPTLREKSEESIKTNEAQLPDPAQKTVLSEQRNDTDDDLSSGVSSKSPQPQTQNVMPLTPAVEDVSAGAAAPPVATSEQLAPPIKALESEKETIAADLDKKTEPAVESTEMLVESKAAKSSRKKEKAASEVPSAPASANFDALEAAVYYTGGDTALHRQLKTELLARGLNKGFTALLFIDTRNQVQRVEFQNSSDFKREEKKELETILKTLKGFQNMGGSVMSYTLQYKP